MTTVQTPRVHERRRVFVEQLDQLARDLISDDAWRVQQARRVFAELRRSLGDRGYAPEATGLLFDFDPPREEERIWLAVAGMFALHPQISGERSRLGAALARLERQRPGGTAHKRLRQLLAADANALPQHLRSTIRLLAAHEIPVDFRALLEDLVVLLNPRHTEDDGRDVRWQWARDFHRHARKNAETDNDDDTSQEDDE